MLLLEFIQNAASRLYCDSGGRISLNTPSGRKCRMPLVLEEILTLLKVISYKEGFHSAYISEVLQNII